MRKWVKQLFAAALCLTGCSVPGPGLMPPPAPLQQSATTLKWAAYYDTKLPASDFADLDLVVFDRRYHPDFSHLKKSTVVLAYVSMGEVYDDVPERKALEKGKALLHKNPNWGSHVVDLTDAQWRGLVMGYVDNALAHGFDGVMLDTVDSPLEWARTAGPEQQRKMRQAAADLIHDIRVKYPDIKIMVNRGFEILPLIGQDIDYILAESILSYSDVSSGHYRQLPPKTYAESVDRLHAMLRSAKNIKVMTLDYWDLDDGDGVRDIYQKQRDAGFSPYVTTPDLRHFTPEISSADFSS